MTVSSGFFNSVNGDRVYDASWFADYFASFIGNGIFPNPSTGMQVVEGTKMTTVIKPGKAWINGYYVVNDNDYVIEHDRADGALKRIDRIVLQKSTADRAIKIVVKKGAFASNPVTPSVVRDADFYELVLADVLINAGATAIIQGNITDQRLNKSLCGIAHAVVDQVDTTTIFNQYQSWFNDYSVTKAGEFQAWQTNVTTALEQWIDAQEQDFIAWRQAEENLYYAWLQGRRAGFDSWFATIQDILDTNVAGNLYQEIERHISKPLPHIVTDSVTGTRFNIGLGVEDGKVYIAYEEVIEE